MNARLTGTVAGEQPAYGLQLTRPSHSRRKPGSSDLVVSVLDGASSPEITPEWFHGWPDAHGQHWLLFGKMRSAYILRFPGLADFRLGQEPLIECWPNPDLPDYSFDHLLLDVVLPLFLSLHGRLVLHGSAVTDGTRTVAVVGPSGCGKSTLAGFLVKSGWQLLTDDAVVVEAVDGPIQIVPAYPGLRLWPDSADQLFPEHGSSDLVAHYMSKLRIAPLESAWPPPLTPLSAVFLAQPGSDPTVTSVTRRDAVIGLSANVFHVDPTDPGALANSFAQVGELVRQVPVLRLTLPREWCRLSAVAEAVRLAAVQATSDLL